MAMSINTNVVSINAQRNLGLSGNSLSVSMQRLSSGLRVNSAKDDAAGLAIAERMGAQMRGLQVAARNANDGISLAQTAEGALGKMGDMLQRMRELAVQSSNATNSTNDRKALQAEVSQLRSEIDRVAKTTSFNGKNLLDGSFSGALFQVGAGAGDNITVGDITNAKVKALGKAEYGSNASATVKASDITNLDAIKDDVLKIRLGNASEISLGSIAKASSGQERLGQVVSAINAKTADTGVTAFLAEAKVDGEYTVELRSDSDKGVSLTGFTQGSTGVGRMQSVGFSATNYSTYTSVISTIDGLLAKDSLDTGGITVTNITGLYTSVDGLDAAAASVLGTTGGTANAAITTALANLTAAVVPQGLSVAGVSTSTSSVAATALTGSGVIAAWKTTSNQGVYTTGGTPSPWVATPDAQAADVEVVKNALNELKTALGVALEVKQAANLAPVDAAMTAALAATNGAGFVAALAVGSTGLTAALAGASLTTPPLVAGITASSTAEQLAAAKEQLVSDINYQLASGFGIQTSQVKEQVGIHEVDVGTQAGAWGAIKHIDSAMDQVNAARGKLGALQTRFDKTVENIDIMNENISAARGRIVDADFASETANLSRSQILQQAGTAMVAQANQLPQQVLSLLR